MSGRRRADRAPRLLVFTAGSIVIGLAAVAWTIATFPIDPAIALTVRGDREGILLGLLFWIGLGLLGGTRVQQLHGHGALTFHLPFIVAAMALGGPTAGVLVAFLGTWERRELDAGEMPWYGALSNHAHLALAAVAGGIVLQTTESVLTARIGPGQEVVLVAIVLASLTFAVASTAFAGLTVVLRDRLTLDEALRVFDSSFRLTAASEVVVGWILVLTWITVGWWATLIAAGLVLVIWQGHDAREIARHDPLTKLLSRAGFEVRLAEAVRAAERHGHVFAVIAIDLDGFGIVNKKYGMAVGDDLIREVGGRIRAQIRLTDAGVRLGGDEYGVLLAGVDDVTDAERVAARLLSSITEPIVVGSRELHVGASFGVLIFDVDAPIPRPAEIHRLSDELMREAKFQDGGGRRAREARGARGEGRMVVRILRASPQAEGT
jgi:diguanylate cyclase (GGDEF)-like protein